MKQLSVVLLCLFLLFPAMLRAQTAAEIETLLGTEALSYEQSAHLIVRAADVFDPASADDSFRLAMTNGWLPKKAAGGAEASLQDVSMLLMHAFNMKGGLFYSLFKNPHYAYRELVYQGVIQGRTDPQMAVPGDLALFMVNRILSRYEEDAQLAAEQAERRRLSEEEAQRLALERERQRIAEDEALAAQINAQIQAQAIADTSARVTDEGVTISLSRIQFQANSAELMETERQKLREIAQIIRGVPGNHRLLVTGHTALADTVEERLITSLERAQAVKDYLVYLGIRRADEILIHGEGSNRPIADNTTAEGMALNRRVEITILGDH